MVMTPPINHDVKFIVLIWTWLTLVLASAKDFIIEIVHQILESTFSKSVITLQLKAKMSFRAINIIPLTVNKDSISSRTGTEVLRTQTWPWSFLLSTLFDWRSYQHFKDEWLSLLESLSKVVLLYTVSFSLFSIIGFLLLRKLNQHDVAALIDFIYWATKGRKQGQLDSIKNKNSKAPESNGKWLSVNLSTSVCLTEWACPAQLHTITVCQPLFASPCSHSFSILLPFPHLILQHDWWGRW